MGTAAPALTLCTGCSKLQIAEISPTASEKIKFCHKSRVQPAPLIPQAHQLNGDFLSCPLVTWLRAGCCPSPAGSWADLPQVGWGWREPAKLLFEAQGGRRAHRSHSQLHPPHWCKISASTEPALVLWAPSASVSPSPAPAPWALSASSINPSLQSTLNAWPFQEASHIHEH